MKNKQYRIETVEFDGSKSVAEFETYTVARDAYDTIVENQEITGVQRVHMKDVIFDRTVFCAIFTNNK